MAETTQTVVQDIRLDDLSAADVIPIFRAWEVCVCVFGHPLAAETGHVREPEVAAFVLDRAERVGGQVPETHDIPRAHDRIAAIALEPDLVRPRFGVGAELARLAGPGPRGRVAPRYAPQPVVIPVVGAPPGMGRNRLPREA